MNKKIIIYTLTTSLVLGLASCTSEDFWDTFDRTADGPIDFTVGVESSPAQRSLTRAGAPTYYSMQSGTQVRMRVDGIWKKGSTDNSISQKTTCKINSTNPAQLDFSEGETLYWDDYGAGDPGNSVNTDKGLNILAVAVDGMATAPAISTDAEWESLSWPLITDGVNVLVGDIIVSNNLTTNPYKFAKRNDEDAKKMIFTHPLSKITFNINAGEGFPTTGVGVTTKKFTTDPTLTLSNATTLAGVTVTDNNYAISEGTINISTGTASNTGTKAAIIAGTTSTEDVDITVIKQAIVYPGTQLGTDNKTIIAVLNVDNNIYFINAKEIREAMKKADSSTDYKTKPGYNYIINLTINKTGIRTTATVTAWNEVKSDEVYPVINVDAVIGGKNGDKPTSVFNTFSFWRSEDINKGYQHEATPIVNTDGTTDWKSTNTLYWSHHYQHYHFRGIYPLYDDVNNIGPKVEEVGGKQCVHVDNGVYNAATFPSNFVIGMPEIASNTMCGNPDHTEVDMSIEGICARESAINLNFRYMMSQVEVKLKSSGDGKTDNVDLTYAKVELDNVGTAGNILLSNRSAFITDDNNTYALHGSSTEYHDIIVPQSLVNNDKSNKVRFKITVYSDDPSTNPSAAKDVYYADLAPIKVKKSGSTDEAAAVSAWESGVHYVYNLKITKTEIKATATLTDWTTVEASEDVWF